MVKLIVGKKGTGKTGRMIEEINQQSSESKNIVCIEKGERLDQLIKYSVRLINIDEYPVDGTCALLGFIAGICSKDYDLDELYIDSITKVADTNDFHLLELFLNKLDSFSTEKHFHANVMLSADFEELPESIKKYVV